MCCIRLEVILPKRPYFSYWPISDYQRAPLLYKFLARSVHKVLFVLLLAVNVGDIENFSSPNPKKKAFW